MLDTYHAFLWKIKLDNNTLYMEKLFSIDIFKFQFNLLNVVIKFMHLR